MSTWHGMSGHTQGRSRSSVPYVKRLLVASACFRVRHLVRLTLTEHLVIPSYDIQDVTDQVVLNPLLVRPAVSKVMPYTRH